MEYNIEDCVAPLKIVWDGYNVKITTIIRNPEYDIARFLREIEDDWGCEIISIEKYIETSDKNE